MQILKVRTITEFETAEVPEGSLLVFPERQVDGSYLWRCKDPENNTGTIGTGVESVNGKSGTNIVLDHSDVGAVAEDLNAEYGRPDTLLSQMMFFIRNGAVNLYATLADLKNFLTGYFADITHNHTTSEITDFQTVIESKLDKALLVPTTAVYIDGNRSDDYTEDGSIAYPYKTIAAATAAHQEPASYFIAKGTYAESAEINLYADSVIYGAYSTISGAAVNIGEGCYVHNLMFYNTVNVGVNGNSPMFHYCRFMEATLNLDGSTDFDGCYISGSTTFNVTMAAAYPFRAFNTSFNTVISAACCMYFNDCAFNVASSGYAVNSVGGLLSMVSCLVYNMSTGGGIFCDNGADGITTYNFLSTVATNKDIACGTAVSIIGGDVQYASLTGVAVLFPARMQTALAAKATVDHNHDAIYAVIDHSHSEYALTGHNHDGVYAAAGHSHAINEITGLQNSLDDKAAVDHNHDNAYSAIGHSHSEYALTGHNHNGVYSAVGHGHAVSDVTGLQTELDGKQTKAAAYNLGTGLAGAISLNIANGDTQYGALSGAATLAYGAIGNLDEGQGFILQLDNAAGQTFEFASEIFGNILILDSGNTGIYKIAFSKVNGKICYDGKSEVYC
jgi:hypothetical protein